MVSYWIVLFTGLRAAIINFALMPLAQWAGVQKKKDLTRFAEQAWLLIYYSVFWSLGMVGTSPRMLYFADELPSIFCTIPTTGLISKAYGLIGQTGRLMAY